MSNIKKGSIIAGVLNIRKGPSTKYEMITKVYKNEIVEIIESLSGWYKVKLPSEVIGWASGDYIKLLSNNENNLDNNGQNDNLNTSDKIDNIIKFAKAQLGKPYEWAAEGPNSFDCSGLVYYVYAKNGIDLPRVSKQQYKVGKYIDFKNIQPGDLLFSSTNRSGQVSHVGIYIGSGNMIHAPNKGDVVKIVSINNSYWNSVYIGAKRVV